MFKEPDTTIRIVAVDDHPIARRGLREVLAGESDIEVVAEGADGTEARERIAEHRPHVAVMDLFMPGRPVLELLPELAEEFPETRVVILTMQGETAYVRRALAAGAAGYVLKDGADDDLVEAIRTVADGNLYVNSRMAAQLATEEAVIRPGGLSPRQLEILRMLALGFTNTQIGEQLLLSVRTVETHRAHIQQKLDVRERHELVQFALGHGLIGTAA